VDARPRIYSMLILAARRICIGVTIHHPQERLLSTSVIATVTALARACLHGTYESGGCIGFNILVMGALVASI